MKHYQRLPLILISLMSFMSLATHSVSALTIKEDFDSVGPFTPDNGIPIPGNTFASSGVTFFSGDIPNSVSINDIVTFDNVTQNILIFSNVIAISPPNSISSSGVYEATSNDLLMSFDNPITSLELITDDGVPENPDIVRLLALEPTGNPFEFQVLGVEQAFDDGVSAIDNQMSINLGGIPFSYALFQTTTEAEAIDNLTFEEVPEPSTVLGTIVMVFVAGLKKYYKK